MGVACESCGHQHDGWVPRDRLEQVASKARTEAEAKVAEIESKLAEQAQALEASAAAGETLAQAQARIAELEAATGSLTRERAIIRAGITDDEGIGIVGTLYSALPEDQRPASVEEWLQSDTLPRAVRAYLPQTPAASEGEPTAAPPPAPAPAAPPAQAAPGSRGVVSTEPPARGAGIKLTDLPKEEMARVLAGLRPA